MTENKTYNHLELIGKKLGLEDDTIRKAQELYRLCCIKSNLDKINDFPKGVLCLDLAAKSLGDKFNKDTALKYSTLSQANYRKIYNIVEKSLELQERLSIQELCVILNCSEAKELAETILCKYREFTVVHDDLNHPQYNTIAVFTACNLKDIKISRRQFIQQSHLKPAQFKQLELKFSEFTKQVGMHTNIKKNKKSEDNVQCNPLTECTDNTNIDAENKEVNEEIEDYNTWKARILKEAYEALDMPQN